MKSYREIISRSLSADADDISFLMRKLASLLVLLTPRKAVDLCIDLMCFTHHIDRFGGSQSITFIDDSLTINYRLRLIDSEDWFIMIIILISFVIHIFIRYY